MRCAKATVHARASVSPICHPNEVLDESPSDPDAITSGRYCHFHLPPAIGSLLASNWRETQLPNPILRGLLSRVTPVFRGLSSQVPSLRQTLTCCYFTRECKPKSEGKGERGKEVERTTSRSNTEQATHLVSEKTHCLIL